MLRAEEPPEPHERSPPEKSPPWEPPASLVLLAYTVEHVEPSSNRLIEPHPWMASAGGESPLPLLLLVRGDEVCAAAALRAGDLPIWVMEDEIERGVLVLELVPLKAEEMDVILDRLQNITRR